MNIFFFALPLLFIILPLQAAKAPDLPGRDITDSPEFIRQGRISQDTVRKEPAKAQQSSWLSPSIQEQLARDKTLIPMGYGAVFVPSYSSSRREPEVTVYSEGGKPVKSGQTGQRIQLSAGTYRVALGSGPLRKKMKLSVVVEEGHTTVVPPTWSGLIVETVSPDGEYLNAQYEVIDMDAWTSYGKGFGLTEERLEDIEAWVLPPGLYRISKVGESFTSYRNFITVDLKPGELRVIELSMNTDGDIVGGGVKTIRTRQTVGKNWRYGIRAGGNLSYVREVDQDNSDEEIWRLLSDVRIRAKYDNTQFFGISEVIAQNSFDKVKGEAFRPSSDNLELRSTWVRRLNDYLGPYVRGKLETHLFPERLPDTGTVRILEEGILHSQPARDFVKAPSFFPLRLGEGAGVNVELFSNLFVEATTQFGVAARQEFARDVYTFHPVDSAYRPLSSVYDLGYENILILRTNLGSYLTMDVRTEMFSSYDDPLGVQLESLNLDARLYLTRNLEVGYIFQMSETTQNAVNRFPRQHSVLVRLSLNF